MATTKKSATGRRRKDLRPVEQVEMIRDRLGRKALEPPPISYLDTSYSDLNAVIGKEGFGVPWGSVIELYGRSSLGKTALGLDLLGMAQKQGATGIVVDFENSFDPDWAQRRGVDLENLFLYQPYLVAEGRAEVPRLVSVEELLKEVEELLFERHKQGQGPFFTLVDSLAAMLTDKENAAGLDEANLTSDMSRPKFIGRWLRRWMGLSKNFGNTCVLINQIRTNPMQMFGNPNYTPGGNAPGFYCHVRLELKKLKKGRVLRKGKPIGLLSTITAVKNKIGGAEGGTVGYKMLYQGASSFLSASEVRSLVKE